VVVEQAFRPCRTRSDRGNECEGARAVGRFWSSGRKGADVDGRRGKRTARRRGADRPLRVNADPRQSAADDPVSCEPLVRRGLIAAGRDGSRSLAQSTAALLGEHRRSGEDQGEVYSNSPLYFISLKSTKGAGLQSGQGCLIRALHDSRAPVRRARSLLLTGLRPLRLARRRPPRPEHGAAERENRRLADSVGQRACMTLDCAGAVQRGPRTAAARAAGRETSVRAVSSSTRARTGRIMSAAVFAMRGTPASSVRHSRIDPDGTLAQRQQLSARGRGAGHRDRPDRARAPVRSQLQNAHQAGCRRAGSIAADSRRRRRRVHVGGKPVVTRSARRPSGMFAFTRPLRTRAQRRAEGVPCSDRRDVPCRARSPLRRFLAPPSRRRVPKPAREALSPNARTQATSPAAAAGPQRRAREHAERAFGAMKYRSDPKWAAT